MMNGKGDPHPRDLEQARTELQRTIADSHRAVLRAIKVRLEVERLIDQSLHLVQRSCALTPSVEKSRTAQTLTKD